MLQCRFFSPPIVALANGDKELVDRKGEGSDDIQLVHKYDQGTSCGFRYFLLLIAHYPHVDPLGHRLRMVAEAEQTLLEVGAVKALQRRALLSLKRLIDEGKVIALVTCSIHSTEVGSTQMVTEFIHDFATTDDPEIDEGLLGARGVGQEEVRIALAAHAQGRARSDRDHTDADARAFGERRDQLVQEPGVPNARGGRQNQGGDQGPG